MEKIQSNQTSIIESKTDMDNSNNNLQTLIFSENFREILLLIVRFVRNPNYFICVHDFLSQIQYHVDQMGDSLTQTQKQELMNYIQFLANNCRDPRRRG